MADNRSIGAVYHEKKLEQRRLERKLGRLFDAQRAVNRRKQADSGRDDQ